MEPTPNSTEISRALQLLHGRDGTLIELRILRESGVSGGFYRDRTKLISDAVLANSAGHNTYITMNEITPDLDLYLKAPDQLCDPHSEATKDRHIVKRRWLLIDCDPIRPSKVSATDAEKAGAFQTVRQVRQYLVTEQGWPEPVMCDSGNGYHLLFSLGGIEATPSLKQSIKRFLAALAKRFNNDQVKIDRSVFNNARIVKLYGSISRKGASTPERPHRISTVRYVPEKLIAVTVPQIEAATGSNPQASTAPPPALAAASPWDIDALLVEHNIQATKDASYVLDDGTIGVRWELPVCVWDAEHNDGAAWIVQRPNGAVAAGCHHDGCADKGWTEFKLALGMPGSLPQLSFAETQEISPKTAQEFSSNSRPEMPLEAFHGLLGRIVKAVSPYTEADPVAVLAHLLVMLGHAIGRQRFCAIGDTRHFLKLFAAIVGRTSVGRKGTALDVASNVFDLALPTYSVLRHGGLSTGEGLIHKVRDPILKTDKEGNPSIVDEGVADKRALFIETELTSVLQRFRREGNTLSQVLRDAWDDKRLSISTRNHPLTATETHIAVIGHASPFELMTDLRPVDIASGLANRFLWFWAAKRQSLPDAPATPEVVVAPLVEELKQVLALDEGCQAVGMTPAAAELWNHHYHELERQAEEADARTEGLLARAPAQIRRVAGIYAAADQMLMVDVAHLNAALAIIDYSRRTLQFLFTNYMTDSPRGAAGDPEIMAARIWEGLGFGSMTRTAVSRLFSGNRSAAEIDAAIELLLQQERIVREVSTDGPGRPKERYRRAV